MLIRPMTVRYSIELMTGCSPIHTRNSAARYLQGRFSDALAMLPSSHSGVSIISSRITLWEKSAIHSRRIPLIRGSFLSRFLSKNSCDPSSQIFPYEMPITPTVEIPVPSSCRESVSSTGDTPLCDCGCIVVTSFSDASVMRRMWTPTVSVTWENSVI